MFCPLEDIELSVEVCPVRCMYRRRDGSCAHSELAFDDGLTPEQIAKTLRVPLEVVRTEAQSAVKKVQTALVVDAYVGYAMSGDANTVNTHREDDHPVFRLFNFPRDNAKRVLNRERYEKWRETSKVDAPFDDVVNLFKNLLKAKGT